MLPFAGLFNVQPPSVVNPDWEDIQWSLGTTSGTITSKLLTYDVTLKVVNLTSPSNIQLFYQVAASEATLNPNGQPTTPPWIQVADSPGSTFAVTAGQWVKFTCYSTSLVKISPQTVEVRNNANNALIDTFTVQVVA